MNSPGKRTGPIDGTGLICPAVGKMRSTKREHTQHLVSERVDWPRQELRCMYDKALSAITGVDTYK